VRGPCAGPSQVSLLKGSPSRRPRARGAGPQDCGGRARTASRRAPQCGARELPWLSPAGAALDREDTHAGGKGVRAVAVRWTRRWGSRRAAACPGRARFSCPVGQQGGAQYGAPAPPPWGAVLRAPPCRESFRGRCPRCGAAGARGGAPTRPRGLIKKGSRRGTDGAPVHYRPPPFTPSLLELRAPPRPSGLIASPFPSYAPSSSPLPY